MTKITKKMEDPISKNAPAGVTEPASFWDASLIFFSQAVNPKIWKCTEILKKIHKFPQTCVGLGVAYRSVNTVKEESSDIIDAMVQ